MKKLSLFVLGLLSLVLLADNPKFFATLQVGQDNFPASVLWEIDSDDICKVTIGNAP